MSGRVPTPVAARVPAPILVLAVGTESGGGGRLPHTVSGGRDGFPDPGLGSGSGGAAR